MFVVLSMICHAQDSQDLTAADRINYVINIDLNILSKTNYSLPKGNGYMYTKPVLFVRVTLANRSNDTLKYLSMSCSWDSFYIVDKQNIAQIPKSPCQSNFPVQRIVLPHSSVTVKVPIIKIKDGKFRIGMTLLKVVIEKSIFDSIGVEKTMHANKNKNVIWSKPIKLP